MCVRACVRVHSRLRAIAMMGRTTRCNWQSSASWLHRKTAQSVRNEWYCDSRANAISRRRRHRPELQTLVATKRAVVVTIGVVVSFCLRQSG